MQNVKIQNISSYINSFRDVEKFFKIFICLKVKFIDQRGEKDKESETGLSSAGPLPDGSNGQG